LFGGRKKERGGHNPKSCGREEKYFGRVALAVKEQTLTGGRRYCDQRGENGAAMLPVKKQGGDRAETRTKCWVWK